MYVNQELFRLLGSSAFPSMTVNCLDKGSKMFSLSPRHCLVFESQYGLCGHSNAKKPRPA